MTPFIGEIIGTMLLIILGNGVVANVALKESKGNGGGWIVVVFGWGMAVFVAVYSMGQFSGAHINPAVTLGLAIVGKFSWTLVPTYILGQMIGACIGAFLVWLFYRKHFQITEDNEAIKACFCTSPAIRSTFDNVMSEIIGTFVLVFGVFFIAAPDVGIGALDALPVSLLVFAIGLSLGGTTGYAINPARDLGPRIIHTILPIPNKRNSDWGYSWVPVIGPIIGTFFASGLYLILI